MAVTMKAGCSHEKVVESVGSVARNCRKAFN